MLIFLMFAAEFLLFALPAILWVVIGRQDWVEAFSWRKPTGREMLGAALMGLGLLAWAQTIIVCQNHLWPGLIASQHASSASMFPILLHHPWLLIFSLSLSAAFSEELFFRGPLQHAFVRRLPVGVAICLTSLLFAAVHFDLTGFIVRALLGVLLSIVILRGRSIFPVMTMHFVYDAAALGSSAWGVHVYGLNTMLRLASQADLGLSRSGVILSFVVGTLLLAVGWGLCASGWKRKRAKIIEGLPAQEGPEEVIEA